MFALPATLAVFALILVLARLKVPLCVAIVLGALTMGVLYGTHGGRTDGFALSGQVGFAAVEGIVQPRSIALTAITFLLMVTAALMQTSGQYAEIVDLAKALLRRPSIAMASLPALVGLLPMPGGALFSAPMVRSAAGEGKASAGSLSAINYWFRHIWEHWWPLYPGVVLAVGTIKVNWGRFILTQFPLGLGMVAAGLLLLRGMHASLHARSKPPPAGTIGRLLWNTSSIWIILLVWLVVRLTMSFWLERLLPASLRSVLVIYAPLAVGLIVSVVWTIRFRRLGAGQVRRCLTGRNVYAMAGIVLAVMVFQFMLERVDAAAQIASELADLHVPVLLVVVVLPFVAGMVTGIAVGFVGTSFPIVLAAVQAQPQIGDPLPYMVLAYAFGHLGQMLSPLHVCHVVSNRFFGTGFGPVYRRILPSAAVAGALAMGYFLLLRWLS
jgi:integral membrane protein (TIGR00529 family)